jgi:hypothetical protein
MIQGMSMIYYLIHWIEIYLFYFFCSEKQRIPGWTDRILFKGAHLKQLQYSRAELYTSDHRPGTI